MSIEDIKIGGHRPDSKPVEFYHPATKAMFGSSAPVYNGANIDLRKYSLSRHNQGQTSSCVAQSIIKALEIKWVQKHGPKGFQPLSVLDLYFGARDLMDPSETDQDAGTEISLACDVLRRFGVCREVMHPFELGNLFIPPPIMATREAYLNKITSHFRVNTLGWDRVDDFRLQLSFGNPIVMGVVVDNNWLYYDYDSQPLMPAKWENSKGRHAICVVGIDGDNFIIENSWALWGHDGFAYIRPEVIADDHTLDPWVMSNSSNMWTEDK